MFTKKEKYMINESKINTIVVLVFVSIMSIIFLGLMFRFDALTTQVAGVAMMAVMFYFLFTMNSFQNRQKELLKEIEAD